MLEDNPVLKERLRAVGAFAGIAMFAVAAVDVMLTGGFDFAPGRTVSESQQPSAYVRVVDAAQYVSDRVRTISWDEPMFIGEADAATSEELAGANDGSSHAISGPSGDELYSESPPFMSRASRKQLTSKSRLTKTRQPTTMNFRTRMSSRRKKPRSWLAFTKTSDLG